jgi:hypothetical protein
MDAFYEGGNEAQMSYEGANGNMNELTSMMENAEL